MRLKQKERWSDPARHRLSLIALIDVVLFLLLYFIIAGTLALPESELSSALKSDKSGGGKGSDLTPQVLFVEAGPSGAAVFRLGQRIIPDQVSLTSLIKELPKEGGIFVKVAGTVPVEAGASALQACKDAGFVRITYVPSN
jgi:biopolymer transport protein ExbD